MSILTKEDRKDLVWAMRTSLLEQVKNVSLTESASASARNFILNEATYEQLLNLAFNPERETNYKPIEVLEQVAIEEYAQVVQEGFMNTAGNFLARSAGRLEKSAPMSAIARSRIGKTTQLGQAARKFQASRLNAVRKNVTPQGYSQFRSSYMNA